MNKIIRFCLFSLFLVTVLSCRQHDEDYRHAFGKTTDLGNYIQEDDIFYRGDINTVHDSYIKEKCRLDIYYPKNGKNLTTIFFVHGGYLTGGDKFIPEAFLDKGFIIVSVNYRLSPNVRHPAYIEDVAAAMNWTFQNIEKYGGSREKIYLTGHSAGAYLASMIFFDKSYLQKYHINSDSLLGLYSFSGQMTTHMTVYKEETGNTTSSASEYIDQYAPLYHTRKTDRPIYLYVGDRTLDLAGRYTQNVLMKEELEKKGCENVFFHEFTNENHGTMLDAASKVSINNIYSE